MIKINKLAQIEKKNFVIKEIYNAYRYWYVESEKKYRTFIKFPYSDDEVLEQWSDRIQEVKALWLDWKTCWREKKYNNWFTFTKVEANKDFYKAFAKVFDIVVEFETPEEVEYYKYPEWNVKSKEKEVIVTAVSAWKVKNLIATLCDEEPKMIEWKDKLGKPALVPEFDYEDTMKDLLKWKFVKFKTMWTGMDTKYIFSEWKEFAYTSNDVVKEDKELDIFEEKKSAKPKLEIDISSIPF